MKLTFHGAASRVTGSCHLLEVGGKRVLLDCGLIQGGGEEDLNARAFPFDPASIDAVLLSHAHIDHSGRLPLLVKRGFAGVVHATPATADLCRILLKDSAFLNQKDAELESRKRARRGLPPVHALYDQDDVEACMALFETHDYGEKVEVAAGVTASFHDAGHILGSAIVSCELADNGVNRKLVFSGDLGHAPALLLRQPDVLDQADIVLCESTYGDRCHRDWQSTWQELGDIIRSAHSARGNILIPSFAVGRTQDLLYVLGKHYADWQLDRWQIFLDSPLAIEATELYARHWELYQQEAGSDVRQTRFRLPNLHFCETPAQSMALNERHSGAIIIAGSGMCTGGRIRHHFKHNLWRPEAKVVIVGFQAEGTPGRALVNGAEYLTLWGEPVRVAAQVHTVGGLSAHADQQGLKAWLEHFRERPPLVLVHGEPQAADALATVMRESAWSQVAVASEGAVVDLKALPTLAVSTRTKQ
ncbi:MAG: MBL fold metallo-hydrolase [Gammaproteobacteria bacterium]|nr:MBL fold metallo-hydrolase [Gammaproteobacteria bacterium]